ncbi:uncharacterized protein EKO05_0009509 [Ascochyta rabiei]|uniref:uncharacterized protein n=1 Tax=Didymella rabiei TaxID=5454 RepID=UPI0018FFCC9E|nr:uncharacterized protein EKO05_0009509 [Ascochyta rabiei]UPX19240.1 hypothetical protein EKO05_0009509 [Ascochyta rabiei]
MVQLRISLASSLITLLLYTLGVTADGTGLIGYGKTLYNPPCTFACRSVIRKQTLSCTPSVPTENHGTAHNAVSTPPKCFVQDASYLKTMALCIDIYCTLSDNPPLVLIEDYWASHLGTGTLGDYQYVPVISYHDALSAARYDESDAIAGNFTTASVSTSIPEGLVPYKVSSPLAITTGGSGVLNKTQLVSPVQWQLQYNYLMDFEANEKGHSTMTLVIAVVAVFLPILLSLLRFVPSLKSSWGWSYVKSMLIYPPLVGKHHRKPVAEAIVVPNRGQSLYILLISFLNIILLIAPYSITQPQASYTSQDQQTVGSMGDRAGTMAMGNVVALFLFSSRNSFLLYLTDWSYSTYLLLHRWLGYWAVIQTVIHSAMLWGHYVKSGSYAAEILRLYWIWGIVGTVAVCAIVPLSLLKVRQQFYELFIISHIALTLLFLIGYYYHIWYVYQYNWGYEIWMFVPAGIWALERLIRIGRMVFQGSQTAIVTLIPNADNEYIRIDIEGKALTEGVAYLCFPTLSWRFWETHPFSVSGSSHEVQQNRLSPQSHSESNSGAGQDEDNEKGSVEHTIADVAIREAASWHPTSITTFFARARGGITKTLTAKASGSHERQFRLRVLIDGPYDHSGRVLFQIAQCSSMLCIAGGVGITACLPLLRQSETRPTKLFWSSRKHGLVEGLTASLNALSSNVKVETLVGQRFELGSIIYKELVDHEADVKGPLAIVVSGPPGLADDVRIKVIQSVRGSARTRPYVLVDEAFSW